jgi:hypothetical protein
MRSSQERGGCRRRTTGSNQDGRGRTGQSGPSRENRCTPTPRDPRPSRDDQGRKKGFLVVVRTRGRSRRPAPARRARSTCQPRPSRSLRSPRLSERSGTSSAISPTTRLIAGSTPTMRPTSSDSTATYRLTTPEASGLQRACFQTIAFGAEIWRGTMHRPVVGRCRPTTGQCRDFTLNRSADWMQLT